MSAPNCQALLPLLASITGSTLGPAHLAAFCCSQGQGDREVAASREAVPDTTSHPGPGEAVRVHGHVDPGLPCSL